MRMCMQHWSKIREAVSVRGMNHLVSFCGEDVLRRQCAAVLGEDASATQQDFDPLIAINWSLAAFVMERTGPGIFCDRESEDGMPENRDDQGFNHYCPLCIVRQGFEAHDNESGRCGDPKCPLVVRPQEVPWDQANLESCADAMLKYAVDIKLVTTQ